MTDQQKHQRQPNRPAPQKPKPDNNPKPYPKTNGPKCASCGSPLGIVKETGMCGPCTFGSADALDDF